MDQLWKGAFILAVANIINRVMGFGYRIATMQLIGPGGVGLFEMVFPVYSLILVITTAGIPVAVAKMVAEAEATGNRGVAIRVFSFAVRFLALAGLISSAGLWLSPDGFWLAIFPDPQALLVFRTLIPVVLVVSISSALRGYFQGRQKMVAPAAAQVVEQAIRISIGLGLALQAKPHGVEFAAAALAKGMVLGETAGLAFLIAVYGWHRSRPDGKSPKFFAEKIHVRDLVRFAAPVTASRILATLLLSLQAILIPLRLQASGMSTGLATQTFGQYNGVALSLVTLPTVFTSALALSLIPSLASSYAQGKKHLLWRRCKRAIRFSFLLGAPWAVIFFTMPVQLSAVIFGQPSAGEALRVLALGAPFLYLVQATGGILNGLGRMDMGLKNSILGSLLNLLCVMMLTGQPNWGIKGAAFGAALSWITVGLLNLISIKSVTEIRISFREVAKVPLVASIGMALAILLTRGIIRIIRLEDPMGEIILQLVAGFSIYGMLLIGGQSRT